MSAFFLESGWFWGILSIFLAFVGFAGSRGTGKKAFLFGGVGAGILTAALGAYLVLGVPTDRKAVRASIDGLAVAIANNDVDGVLKFVSQDASRTRRLANYQLRLAKIEWTKVRDYKLLELNHHMSPPRALVRFRGTVSGTAGALEGASFTVVVEFTSVELRKDSDGIWRVTDNCEFNYPGFQTGGSD